MKVCICIRTQRGVLRSHSGNLSFFELIHSWCVKAEEGFLKCVYINEYNMVYPWIFMCTSCGLNYLPSLLHLEEIIMSKKEYIRY